MRTAAQLPTSTTLIPDSAREDLPDIDDTHVITFQKNVWQFLQAVMSWFV